MPGRNPASTSLGMRLLIAKTVHGTEEGEEQAEGGLAIAEQRRIRTFKILWQVREQGHLGRMADAGGAGGMSPRAHASHAASVAGRSTTASRRRQLCT